MRKLMLAICMMIAATMFVADPAYAGGPPPKSEKKDDGHGGAKKSDKKKGKEKALYDVTDGPSNSFYLKLDPMIMPVLGKDNVQETVMMIVALQVAEQKNIAQVSHLIPKIKDAYMSALYGNLNKAAYRNGQFLDVNKLKSKLVLVTESFADKKVIQDVLIQGVSQRRFN